MKTFFCLFTRERSSSTSENVEEASAEPSPKVIKSEKPPRVATAFRRGKKIEPVGLPVLPDDSVPVVPETPVNAPEEAGEEHMFLLNVCEIMAVFPRVSNFVLFKFADDDFDELDADEEQPEEQSLSQILNRHRGEDDYYGGDFDYDDDD